MKYANRLTFVLGIVLSLLPAAILAGGVSSAEVWVAEPEMDFGYVPSNATLDYRSWLHNYSTDTVRLTDIKTGCGCLAVSPREATLMPGDSLQLTLAWQTRALPGPISRTAYIYLDELADPLRIDLSGRPRPATDSTGVTTSSPIVAFDSLSVPRKSLRLRNLTSEKLEVSLISVPDDHLSLELPENLPAQGEGVMIITVDSKEPFEDSFTLEFTSQSDYIYRLSIPVINGDFSFRPVFSKTGL